MKKLSLKLYLILMFWFVLISGFMIACNRVVEDANPSQANEKAEVTTLANNPIIIDLIKKHNISSTNTINFDLIEQPKNGQAQFIKNGLFMYIPDSTQSTPRTDSISYRVCINQVCKYFYLKVNVLEKSALFPCELGAKQDTTYYVANNNNTYPIIDVLANDKFCQNPVNPNSLKIITEPTHGKAQIVKISTDSISIAYQRNKDDTTKIDSFIYSVEEKNNPQNVGYGIVIVIYKPAPPIDPCKLELREAFSILGVRDNDSTYIKGDIINVLAYNSFCKDSVDWNLFKIISPPKYGKAQITPDYKIDYQSFTTNLNYLDYLDYQFGYKNGIKDTTRLWIRYIPSYNFLNNPCQYQSPNYGVDDVYSFKITDPVFQNKNYVDLPVLANDVFCAYLFREFQITNPPNQGTATIVDNFYLRWTLPSRNFRGKVTTGYYFSCYQSIVGANVEIEITD